MLSVYAERHNAECHYAECYYAECHFAECHYGKCHYAERHYMLNVVAPPNITALTSWMYNPISSKVSWVVVINAL